MYPFWQIPPVPTYYPVYFQPGHTYTWTNAQPAEDKAEATLEGLIVTTVESRSGYDRPGTGRHGKAIRLAELQGITVEQYYRNQILEKRDRFDTALERGEVHYDSLLDEGGWAWLLADWRRQKTAE